jgi:hypothetical protein
VRALYKDDWVVYAKPAFGEPTRVLRYLGRYTHRVAISNQRLSASTVTAYASDGKTMRTATSSAS